MTDIQAALGRSQLKRIGQFLKKRRQIAKTYSVQFKNSPLFLPALTKGANSAWHLYVVATPQNQTMKGRDALIQKLHASGIKANLHYLPVQNFHYYQKRMSNRCKFSPCPVAQDYSRRAISIPIYPNLSGKCQKRVKDVLGKRK
jgi:dTDP-4-amino-4,6-dideoxygalactose transaminase